MLSSLLVTALSGMALVNAQSSTTPVTGKLGDAKVSTDNPSGASFTATLPSGSVSGFVSGASSSNGTGVQFTVSFSNLPTVGGPFLYHIHDQPVPADGVCNGTLAHLDPTQRGEMPVCNATAPETCQVGDLSGKHGMITSDPFSASYLDLYPSTQDGVGAFFGNRSINVHFANTTRITCANFTIGGSGSSGSNGTSSNGTSGGTNGSTTSPSSPTGPTAPAFTAGASATVASLSIVLAAAVAAVML